jgi:hypothetical protein
VVDFDPGNPLDLDSEQERKTENPKGKGLMRVIKRIGRSIKGLFSEGDKKYRERRDLDDW